MTFDPPGPDCDRNRREDRLEDLVVQLAALNELGSKNFRTYRRRATAAFVLLAVSVAAAIYIAQHFASVSRGQFCELNIGTHNDKIKRYRTTLEYLRSPAGRERTLLNDYIRRVSLPQTRAELAREKDLIPPVCK
jgi:hypothetical protein